MSAEQELRAALLADLERHADRDVHFFAGFVAAWVARNVPLTLVEELVDQLDSVHPPRHDKDTAWERHDDPEQQS